jgi:hypothetical protein
MGVSGRRIAEALIGAAVRPASDAASFITAQCIGAIHWYLRAQPMTVTIELPPEIEADMLAQAEAEGMPVGEYLQSLLSGQVSARSDKSKLSPEEWIRRFEAWVASHSGTTVVLPDAAMEREAINDDHGR